MRLPRFLLLASLMTIVALPAFSQQLTGKVVVTVLDETGQPFPGVVVQLSNTKSLAPTNAVRTNPQGKAVFGVVPAGSGYKVTIEMAGFAKQEEDSLQVGSGKTVALLFSLQMSAIEEEVEVTGQRPLPTDLDTNPGSMSMSGEFFEDLPVLGRNYQSALTLAPAVDDDDEDGNPNVHGARERDFKVTVDGVSNVDPLTGTFMSNINPDAIEEIEIITEGADASYGRAVGGFGKIITKQGSNEHEGVFKMFYRSDLLDRNGSSSRPKEEFEFDWYRPSVSLTGPILRDKLFYALNHEWLDLGEPVDLVSGGGLVVETNGWRHLDKITWQVTPRNKLNFQYSADPLTSGPLAIDSLTDRQSGVDYEQGGPTYSLTWQAPINANFTVTSVAAFSDTGIEIDPLATQIRNNCVTDQLASQRVPTPIDRDYCFESRTGRRSGGFNQTYSDERQRVTLKSDATWYVSSFLGKEHNFDFGIVYEDESFEDQQVNYPFSIFQEIRVQRFLVPVPPGASGPDLASTGTLNRTVFFPSGPDPLSRQAEGQTYGVYFQDTFRPHPTVSIKAGLRLEREEIEAPGLDVFDPEAEGKLYEKFYLGILNGDPQILGQIPDPQLRQDCSFAAGSRGTSSRCAVFALDAIGKPLTRANFLCGYRARTGDTEKVCEDVLGPSFRDQDVTSFTLTNTNLSPSLSVSWDPAGNGRTRLFSTFSRKYDKIFLAVPIWEQGPYQLNDTYSVIEDDLNPGSFIIRNASSDFQSVPTINQVDRNLRTPYVNEFTAGIAREIAPEMSMTLTYIRRHYKDQFQDIDSNHFAEDKGNNSLPCTESRAGSLPVYTPQGKPDGLFDDCGGLTFFLPTRVGQTGRIGTGVELNERPDGIPDLKLNTPLFNQVFTVGNFNETEYEAYKLEILRRLRNNWEMESSYVWSEAVGNAEDYSQSLGDDPTTVQDETGFLSFDLRHAVKVNLRRIVPIWNMNVGIVARWQSGYPYSNTQIFASSDRIRDFGGFTRVQTQSRTTFPSGQRNDRRNESWYNLDVNAQKHFTVGKTSLTASAEIFNVLNDDALRVIGVRNGNAFLTRRFGRQFQLSMKVNF